MPFDKVPCCQHINEHIPSCIINFLASPFIFLCTQFSLIHLSSYHLSNFLTHISITYHSHLVDSSNGKARKVFLCSLWLLPVLLGTFVFHSRVWSEEELEQRSLLLIANGNEEISMQPMGMIAAFRKRMKGVCVHEWIAQYNNYNNNNQNIDNDDDSSNSPINKPKEETTTGTHLCMKLKVIKSTSQPLPPTTDTLFVIYTYVIYRIICI